MREFLSSFIWQESWLDKANVKNENKTQKEFPGKVMF